MKILKADIRKMLMCVLLSFLLGLLTRISILHGENPKIALYQTLKPVTAIEMVINNN